MCNFTCEAFNAWFFFQESIKKNMFVNEMLKECFIQIQYYRKDYGIIKDMVQQVIKRILWFAMVCDFHPNRCVFYIPLSMPWIENTQFVG